jgi:hypothetical protein
MVNIISNGSKWAGEKPDSIGKLMSVLKSKCIDSRMFSSDRPDCFGYGAIRGNFVEVSHVFNIRTNSRKLLILLRKACSDSLRRSRKNYKLKNSYLFPKL